MFFTFLDLEFGDNDIVEYNQTIYLAETVNKQAYPSNKSTHTADLVNEQIYPPNKSTHTADPVTEQIYPLNIFTHTADPVTEQPYPSTKSFHSTDAVTEQRHLSNKPISTAKPVIKEIISFKNFNCRAKQYLNYDHTMVKPKFKEPAEDAEMQINENPANCSFSNSSKGSQHNDASMDNSEGMLSFSIY